MQYVSQFLGTSVTDPAGRVVGKVRDLFVPRDEDYPAVQAVTLQTGQGKRRSLPWSAFAIREDGGLQLRVPLEEVADIEGELSLGEQVLDRQIIDTDGIRVVRANDLQLTPIDGAYRLVGVDVSTAGLVRRLGGARVLDMLHVKLMPRTIPWGDIEPIEIGPGGMQLRVAQDELARLRPWDLAQIISQLDHHHGRQVLERLDDEAAADAMQEIEPELQVSLIKALDAERAADILEEMEPDDAADILGDLEPERAEDLLRRMEAGEAEDVRELLAYGDDCAGGLMTTDVVTVPPYVPVADAIQMVREQAAPLDNVYSVYVVDGSEHLLGALTLRDLIVADPDERIENVMQRELVRGRLTDDKEDVARLVAEYNLLALPIVDNQNRLQGIVTVDDAMDVILPEDWKARVPRMYQHS